MKSRLAVASWKILWCTLIPYTFVRELVRTYSENNKLVGRILVGSPYERGLKEAVAKAFNVSPEAAKVRLDQLKYLTKSKPGSVLFNWPLFLPIRYANQRICIHIKIVGWKATKHMRELCGSAKSCSIRRVHYWKEIDERWWFDAKVNKYRESDWALPETRCWKHLMVGPPRFSVESISTWWYVCWNADYSHLRGTVE